MKDLNTTELRMLAAKMNDVRTEQKSRADVIETNLRAGLVIQRDGETIAAAHRRLRVERAACEIVAASADRAVNKIRAEVYQRSSRRK